MENEIKETLGSIDNTLAEIEKTAEQEKAVTVDLDSALEELKETCAELDKTLKDLRAYIFS